MGSWFRATLRPELTVSGLGFTWRVGGLTKWLFCRVISTITTIRVPFRVLISLLTTYLLSPPTLQVGFSVKGALKEPADPLKKP